MPDPGPVPPSLRVPVAWDEEVMATGATPILEVDGDHQRVTFVHDAPDAQQVYVQVNRVTHTLEHARMEPVPGTSLWAATFRLPREWRGSYSFLVHGAGDVDPFAGLEPRARMRVLRTRGTHDPRNSRREVTHQGPPTSWAEGDRAPAETWLDVDRGDVRPVAHRGPRGRRIWVHRPGGVQRPDRGQHPDRGQWGAVPVVVVLDGAVWVASGAAVAQARSLASAGVIREPVLLFVDSGPAARRAVEMSVDGTLGEYVVEELLPWARAEFGVSADPDDVVVTGESLGGLTALRTALDHPDAVGAALSQSASLWQDDLVDRAVATTRGRFFLTVGCWETSMQAGHARLEAELARSGRLAGFVEYVGGHDMACWRGFWGTGLAALAARPSP